MNDVGTGRQTAAPAGVCGRQTLRNFSKRSGIGGGAARALGLGLGVVVAVWLCFVLPAFASTYSYDANGRLHSITNAQGVTATYDYDVRGNLLRISSSAAAQLVITAFEPGAGMAGQTVTISGQGFGPGLGDNTVTINGVSAPVTSASATTLVVSVPLLAPTGSAPIAVTYNGNTVYSADPFTVTDAGLPPTLSSVVDSTTGTTAGSSGDTITLSGDNLDPIPGQTTVLVDGIFAASSFISSSNSQLQFYLPAWVGSGPVTVITPFGTATSAMPFVVLPIGTSPTSVNPVQSVTVDDPATGVSLGGSNQLRGIFLFQGDVGDFDSLQITGFSSTSAVAYTVQSPLGVVILSGSLGTGTTNTTLNLPVLVERGTYSVLFSAGSGSASFSVAISSATTLTANAVGVNVSTATAGQSARLTFAAAQGDNLGLALSSLSLSGSTTVTIYEPDGTTQWTSKSCSGTGCTFNLTSVPSSGVYRLIATAPSGGGTMSFTATLSADEVITVPMNPAGTPTQNLQSVSLPTPGVVGQNAWLKFTTSTAFSPATLRIDGIGTTPSSQSVAVSWMRPDGSSSQVGTPTSSLVLNYGLYEAGTYYVFLDPYGLSTLNTVTATLLDNPVAGDLGSASGGAPSTQNFVTPVNGQSLTFTFTAQQGENLALALYNMVYSGTIAESILNPDGVTTWKSQTCSGVSCTFNLTNAPMTGTYTVTLGAPTGGGTMSLTATLSDDLGPVTLPINATGVNPAQTVSISSGARGQNGWLEFDNTTIGQTYTVTLNSIGTDPSGGNLYFTMYNPQGSSWSIGSSTSSVTYSWTAYQTGTYKIFVDPEGARAITNVTAKLIAGAVTPPVPPSGNPIGTYTTTQSGQSISMVFNANQGDNLGLAFTTIATTGVSNNQVNINIYNPSTSSSWMSQSCTAGNACAFNLTDMPYTGTYQIVIKPNGNAGTMTVGAVLSTDIGPIDVPMNAVDASPLQSAQLSTPATNGQNVWFQFQNTSVKHSITLAFSGISTDPSPRNVTLTLYHPDGAISTLGSPSLQQAFNWEVNELGTFQIFADSYGNSALQTMTVTLLSDDYGQALARPTLWSPSTGSYTTTLNGQAQIFTFTGNTGDNLQLSLLALNLANVSGNYVSVAIYEPDGSTTAWQSQSWSPGSNSNFDLLNLPETGMYKVVVTPNGSWGTMSFGATLSMSY